jgi:uncharacterized protein (DUF2062 family)
MKSSTSETGLTLSFLSLAEEEEEDNTGTIVGAVIGSLVGVGVICGAAGYVIQKNKKKRKVRSANRAIVPEDNGGLTPV